MRPISHVVTRPGRTLGDPAVDIPVPQDLATVPGIPQHRPTVSLGVTSAVVCTYGYDDGRILPTRCAIIDAGLDGRCRLRRRRRTPPAAARSARNALAAGLRPVSTADPGAFPRSRTTPPVGIRPCGDASRARAALGTHPC